MGMAAPIGMTIGIFLRPPFCAERRRHGAECCPAPLVNRLKHINRPMKWVGRNSVGRGLPMSGSGYQITDLAPEH